MPLFAYACQDCGAETEILLRGEEKPACGACGSKKLLRLASHFATTSGTKSEPVGCGAPSCCQMQGGGCMN